MNSAIPYLIATSILLAIMLLVGGRPWAAICFVTLVIQVLTEPQATRTIAGITPCILWLVLFRITGNRELFFPFSMYLASYASLLLAGRILLFGVFGGGTVVAAFVSVRVLQSAAKDILGVELVVAFAILTLALAAYNASPRNVAARLIISVLASLLAYAGLAI